MPPDDDLLPDDDDGDDLEHERDSAPESVPEAFDRARRHGRAAAAETLAMVQALLDAAALIANGEPSQAHPLLGPLAKLLEDLELRLGATQAAEATPVLTAIAEALDAEIARWEERARVTPEARSVLRAFLGLRELLWEFGVRRAGEPTAETAPNRPRGTARSSPRRRRARVQRVPVEG